MLSGRCSDFYYRFKIFGGRRLVPIVVLIFFLVLAGPVLAQSDECTPIPGCGGPGPCEPGTTCTDIPCDNPCIGSRTFTCGDDGKWWMTESKQRICGQVCGKLRTIYLQQEKYKRISNSICDNCALTVFRRIKSDTEVPESKVICYDESRPPEPVETTLECVDKVSWEEYSNDEGVGNATPPGTKYTWTKDVVTDSGCPKPERVVTEDSGCIQGNSPC